MILTQHRRHCVLLNKPPLTSMAEYGILLLLDTNNSSRVTICRIPAILQSSIQYLVGKCQSLSYIWGWVGLGTLGVSCFFFDRYLEYFLCCFLPYSSGSVFFTLRMSISWKIGRSVFPWEKITVIFQSCCPEATTKTDDDNLLNNLYFFYFKMKI